MPNKKLFVFDVDGTIVTDQKHLLPGTIKAVELLLNQGHAVVLASGRIPNATSYYYRRLGLRDYVIGATGAVIYDLQTRKYIASKPVDKKYVDEIIGYAQEIKREVVLTNGEQILRFYFGKNPLEDIADPDFFMGGSSTNPVYDDFNKWKNHLNEFKVIQISLKAEKDIINEWFDYVKDHYKNLLTVFESSKVYIDICQNKISKASAIAFICKKLNINQDDTYVFGDSENDLQAMLFCGTAVAMGNAREQVKKIADVVIGDNNRESIYNYLKKEGLI